MSKFRDFEKYEVYEDGRIWSYKRNKFLKPQTNHNGYQLVKLFDNYGKAKWYQLHRVVFETFSGNPIPEGMQVNHINEDKTDNRFFENLNLMTQKQNTNYGTRIERCHKEQSKQVGAFKDGKLVMTFPSTIEAIRNCFSQSAVVSCCNGKMKTYKGYTWKYL